jgi:phosphatidylglycerophosphate synthase
LPWTLAPNVVTITGEMFAVVGYVWLCVKYGWDMNSAADVDSYACYLMAFCWWTNNTFDNMDGKQARRTGSGSPMGALFDHGCDAFTVILSGCVGAKLFSVGNGFYGSLAVFGPSLSFWWVTLE